MSTSTDPVVVTVAPIGAEVTPAQNPYEIDDEVSRSTAMGASVVHILAGRDDGQPTTDPHVLRRINRQQPGPWTVTGFGRHQLPLTTLACAIGGRMRVGFEANIYNRLGQLATSNAELVAPARRLAGELGCLVATPGQARRILGVADA